MKYCVVISKITNEEKTIPIIQEIFEAETKFEKPHYQEIDGKEKIFAKCPSCRNPVTIIGFYKKTDKRFMDNPKKPYGRHRAKHTEGIASYSQEAYKLCPYAKPQHYKKHQKRKYNDKLERQIVNILLKHFDKVVYILRKDLGIHFGKKFLENMMVHYVAMEGWQYRGATLENIPWVFAYMGLSQNLFGQYIEKDGLLHKLLGEKEYGIKFADGDKRVQILGTGNRLDRINCFFTRHKSEPVEGEIEESIVFVVSLSLNKPKKSINILEKKVVFNHDCFFNLIHYDEKWRKNEEQLSLARKHLSK